MKSVTSNEAPCAAASALWLGRVRLPHVALEDIGRLIGLASDRVHACPLAGLTPARLAQVAPHVVLSPLAWAEADAWEAARRLHEIGYRGRYLALAGALPDTRLVEREIAAAAPGIDFRLVALPPRLRML